MTSLCILDAPLCPLRRNMSVQVVPVSLRANISLRSTNGCLQLEPNWTVSVSHPIYTEVFLLFVWLWIIHVESAQALKTTLVWFPVWTALEGDILTEFTWRFRASEISEVLVPPLQQGLNLDWISCFMTFNSGFFQKPFLRLLQGLPPTHDVIRSLMDSNYPLPSVSHSVTRNTFLFLSESLVAFILPGTRLEIEGVWE